MTSSDMSAVGMPPRGARKPGRLLALNEALPLIRRKPATARGRVLYRLATRRALLWLAHHDATTAPAGKAEGLYWSRKPLVGDEVESRRVGDYPETSLAAVRQLCAIGLLDEHELPEAVDLQHPIARYYREPSATTLPLNTRADPERYLRAIRKSWTEVDQEQDWHADWDPFVLRESTDITFEVSPALLARVPPDRRADLVFEHLAELPPLSQAYVLERMLPRPGLGIYVNAPPGISGKALLAWARRQRGAPPAAPPAARPPMQPPVAAEVGFQRDDWLVLCSETQLLSILKARVAWWREREGRHRVSLQCDLVMQRGLASAQEREVAECILVWAGIRFGQFVEALAGALGEFSPAEGSMVGQVRLHRDIPVPHVTVAERMAALLKNADEWEQVAPERFHAVAAHVALELRAAP